MTLKTLLLGLPAVTALCLAGAATAQEAATLDEVVVTGSRLAGAPLAPVEVLDRRTLATATTSDPSRLLRLVTANSGSEAQIDQLNQPQSSGTAQFNLRNLGLGSTLVLVDGLRWTSSAVVATDGSAFTDINSLVPMIALERVEVVKDGASAIYGSDAIAGVVNFVTRRNVGRPELRLEHDILDGAETTTLEALGGLILAGGDLTLAASYHHASALGSDERDFTQAENYGRPAWSAVTSYGQPSSYFRPSVGGFSPDPDCTNPAFTQAYRNSSTDAFCRLDYSDFFDLAPEETRTQLFADYRRKVGQLDTWLQAAWSSTYTRARQSPSLPILARSPVVPASHPDNPFGEAVLFRGRLLGAEAGASAADFDYRTWRLAGGANGPIRSGWIWKTSAAASRQHVAYDKPDVIGTALQNALNGLGGSPCNPATGMPGVGVCRYVNPFGSAFLGTGTANSPDLIASLIGSTGLRGSADLIAVDAELAGPIFDAGALKLDAAVGVQYRRSGFRQDWSDLVNAGELLTAGYSPDFDGSQDTVAVFAETRWRLGERLEAQLAARYESFDGDGELSPKAAVRLAVTDSLALRASWGRGLRAPSVVSTSGAQAAQPSVLDRSAFVFVNTLTSGDPALKPETSESSNIGAVWTPVEGLELGLAAWRFDYADVVVKEQPQGIIDQAAADDRAGLTGTAAQQRVTRSASGALSFVQLYFLNASSIDTRGLDFSARYGRDVLGGRVEVWGTWTVTDRYDIRVKAMTPTVSGVGSTNLNTLARSLPRDRGAFSASWRDARNDLTALVHYTSGYRNDRSGITETGIASQTTIDLSYARSLASGLALAVGVVNATDQAPPLAQFALGYDPVVADPRGRIVTVSVLQRF